MIKDNNEDFGGLWTLEKLNILRAYLDSYTTALKNQPFNLMYIDAFAGSGNVKSMGYEGSARIALDIKDKPFDKLFFNDLDSKRIEALQRMAGNDPRVTISQPGKDANEFVKEVLENTDWDSWRAVLFLDPFATEVKWETLKQIADNKAVDTWMLFPQMAVIRMLPNEKRPEDFSFQDKLNSIWGGEIWKNLYKSDGSQASMLEGIEDKEALHRTHYGNVLRLYKEQLHKIFGERHLQKSKPLKNATNATLFELIFCAGSPKGIKIAHRIAEHLIDNI